MEVARKGEVHVWLHSHYLCLGMCMHCLIAMTDTDLTATLSKRSSEGCFKIENKETWDAEIIAPPQGARPRLTPVLCLTPTWSEARYACQDVWVINTTQYAQQQTQKACLGSAAQIQTGRPEVVVAAVYLVHMPPREPTKGQNNGSAMLLRQHRNALALRRALILGPHQQ
eukprot:355101-Chlamydomonas_euryale.AAC.13